MSDGYDEWIEKYLRMWVERQLKSRYGLTDSQVDELVNYYGAALKEELTQSGVPLTTHPIYQEVMEWAQEGSPVYKTKAKLTEEEAQAEQEQKKKIEGIIYKTAIGEGIEAQRKAGYLTELTPEQEQGIREYAKYNPSAVNNLVRSWGKTYWRKPSAEVTAELETARGRYARGINAGQIFPYGVDPRQIEQAEREMLGKTVPKLQPEEAVLKRELKEAGATPAMQRYYESQIGNLYGQFAGTAEEDPREVWRENLISSLYDFTTMSGVEGGQRAQKVSEMRGAKEPWEQYLEKRTSEGLWREEFLDIPREYRVGGGATGFTPKARYYR